MTQSDCQAARRTAMRLAAGRAERGFNLIELMVTLTVLGVLVAMGLPEFTKFIRDMKLGGMASDLRADVQYARSESIRRNARVLVCPRASATATTCATTVAATTWANGWLVCYDLDADGACDATSATDPNPSRVRSAIATPLVLSGPAATLIFFPTGSASASLTFTMTAGTTTTRTLVVAPSGGLTSTKTG
jgi:type IV fimbrial biogenesis protein FimT